jgi:hypothetical protein
LIGGCSNPFSSKSAPPPVCPTASVLDEANRITVYRPGAGRDISDIVYEARLLGIDGDCKYDILQKSKNPAEQTYSAVTANLRAKIRVTPGPAMTGFKVPVTYFVAIPAFYPNPEGRSEFTREVETSAARTQVDVTDANIEIRIPLNAERRGESVAIYMGFVLTEEQLRENRTRTVGRIER